MSFSYLMSLISGPMPSHPLDPEAPQVRQIALSMGPYVTVRNRLSLYTSVHGRYP